MNSVSTRNFHWDIICLIYFLYIKVVLRNKNRPYLDKSNMCLVKIREFLVKYQLLNRFQYIKGALEIKFSLTSDYPPSFHKVPSNIHQTSTPILYLKTHELQAYPTHLHLVTLPSFSLKLQIVTNSLKNKGVLLQINSSSKWLLHLGKYFYKLLVFLHLFVLISFQFHKISCVWLFTRC